MSPPAHPCSLNSLILMNLDFVFLEYGHDGFLHGFIRNYGFLGFIRNEKLHSLSIRVRSTAKQITC